MRFIASALPLTALLLAVLVGAPIAAAEDSEAAALFDEGRALMLEGRFEKACPKFELSQQLEPRVGTMLNLAVCHERVGMVASAWVEYQQARDAATSEGRDDQRDLAQERIDVLGPRIPWVTFDVDEHSVVQGLALGLDGAPIDPAEWGEPMPIDPGEHVLVAAAEGYEPREVRFVIAESEQKHVAVARLTALERPPPRPQTIPPKAIEPRPTIDPPPDDGAGQRWVLEIGTFGSFMSLDGLSVSPNVDRAAISLDDGSVLDASNCAREECRFGLPTKGGAVFGASLFAGYAATPWFHVGGRMFAGPRIGGGLLFAAGPTVLFHVAGPFWLGGGAMLGTASASGAGSVDAATPYFYSGASGPVVDASIDLGPGPLLEIAFQLAEWERGALTLNATPMFLAGNGTAIALPFGVGFRFQ
jgi:hypothetical protein